MSYSGPRALLFDQADGVERVRERVAAFRGGGLGRSGIDKLHEMLCQLVLGGFNQCQRGLTVDIEKTKFLIHVDGRIGRRNPEQEALRQRVVGVHKQENSACKRRRNAEFALQEFEVSVSLLQTQQVVSADRLRASKAGGDILFNEPFVPAVFDEQAFELITVARVHVEE